MYRVEILWRDQWYGLRHDSGDTVLLSEESVRKVCKEQLARGVPIRVYWMENGVRVIVESLFNDSPIITES